MFALKLCVTLPNQISLNTRAPFGVFTCLLQPAVRHPQHQFGLVYRKQDTSPHSFVAVGQINDKNIEDSA